MSIVKPTSSQMTRRLIVLATAVFTVVIAYSQVFLGWGQDQTDFAAQGDSTLKVAGFAFSIWGLLYLGVLAYAVRQALPQTGESELIRRVGWSSAVAFLAMGWWIAAAAFDWKWVTLGLIFIALIALAFPLLACAPTVRATPLVHRDRMLLIWPLAVLAGWLTAASVVNLMTVLTALSRLPASPPPTVWALIAVAVVTGAGVFGAWKLRTMAYPAPIAWAFLGVFVAEQDRNGLLAYAALIAAVGLLAVSALMVFRLKPGIERAM